MPTTMTVQEKIDLYREEIPQLESELSSTVNEYPRHSLKNKIAWRKLDLTFNEIRKGLTPSYRLYDNLTDEEKNEKIEEFTLGIKKRQRKINTLFKKTSTYVQILMRKKKIKILKYELNNPPPEESLETTINNLNNPPEEPTEAIAIIEYVSSLDLKELKKMHMAATILAELFEDSKANPGILHHYHTITHNEETLKQAVGYESSPRRYNLRNKRRAR